MACMDSTGLEPSEGYRRDSQDRYAAGIAGESCWVTSGSGRSWPHLHGIDWVLNWLYSMMMPTYALLYFLKIKFQ